MDITLLLDLVGIVFLTVATFRGSIGKVNNLAAGLTLIAFGHLLLPSLM